MSGVGTVIGGALGIAGSLFSSDSKDSSDDYYDQAGNAASAQADASAILAQLAREQWDYYKENYQPIEQEILAEARKGVTPDYGKVSSEVARAFGRSNEQSLRNLTRYGLNPNSGRFAGMQRGLTLARATTETAARSAERQRAEDLTWSRRAQALQMGKNIPTQAFNALGDAASGYSSASRAFGLLAGSQADDALAGAGNAGYWLNQALTGGGSSGYGVRSPYALPF